MKIFRGLALTFAAASILTVASTAQAIPVEFNVSAASIIPGTGYGIDSGRNGENGGSLLGVAFTNTFVPLRFTLNNVGDSFSFALGAVNFNEPDTGNGKGNLGIRKGEQDDLGVSASFNYVNPLGIVSSATLTASGVATTGSIADAEVDYTLTWDTLNSDFGLGGQFSISLNNLSFDNNGSLNETVTVTLTAAPRDAVAALRVNLIPEPASLALLGLGLAGLGFSRRRKG